MTLLPAHAAEIQASSIDPDVAAERGYVSMTADNRDQLLTSKFPQWAAGPDEAYPALFIPMYRVTGEMGSAQLKPAAPMPHPNGKLMKYVSPRHSPNVLDVHPRNQAAARDVSVPLWITEGVKKGDALTSRGLCVVTLSGVFNWRSRLGTLGDWEDIPLRGRQIVICFDSDARGNDNVLAAMRRLGAWLTSKGAGDVVYLVVPASVGPVAVKGVDDYFAAGGDLGGLENACLRTVPVNVVPADPSFTDAYLAGSVSDDRLEGNYLYCNALGGWQRWDGKRWDRCGPEVIIDEVRRYAIEQHDLVLKEYAEDTGSSRVKRRLDGWRTVLARTKLTSVEFLSRGILVASAAEFDADPTLLNCRNGVVDLTTGRLMPHDPDLRMTKVTEAAYVPGAEHPDWKAALSSIPDQIQEWYQGRMGQAITGYDTSDDLLVVQVGTGANGKSTVLESIGRSIGSYYAQISHRALLASSDAHPTELMDLKGARLALIEETPEERRLNVTRLKQVVGTPRIKARYMRSDSAEFDATHSLFLSTNFRPVVDETDHGTWRRLALVEFPYRWVMPGKPLLRALDRQGDPDLRRRMKEGRGGQHEAVLAWLIAGAVRMFTDGVQPIPPMVETSTLAWRAESDSLSGFLADRVVADPGSWITTRDLLDELNQWLKGRGQLPWSDRTLSSRMQGIDSPYMEKKAVNAGQPGRSAASFGGQTVVGSKVKAWVGVRFTDG